MISDAMSPEKRGNLTLRVVHDPLPVSPRDFCTLGTMVCGHGSYSLGDVDALKEFPECRSIGELEKAIAGQHPSGIIALKVRMYDHSGIGVKAFEHEAFGYPWGCPWDSGWVGIIYASKHKIRSAYGVQRITKRIRDIVIEYLKAEVDEYSKFLGGECYGWEITDEDDVVVESCYGYYDECYAKQCGLDELEGLTKEKTQ